MNLLAAAAAAAPAPDQVTPAMMGMVVIILMQLAQFFFAWKKDMRGTESAKKEDLAALKSEFLAAISKVEADVEEVKTALDRGAEGARTSAHNCRNEMHTRITEIALKTAELLKGMQITEQTLISLGTKFDALRGSNNLSNSRRNTPQQP